MYLRFVTVVCYCCCYIYIYYCLQNETCLSHFGIKHIFFDILIFLDINVCKAAFDVYQHINVVYNIQSLLVH